MIIGKNYTLHSQRMIVGTNIIILVIYRMVSFLEFHIVQTETLQLPGQAKENRTKRSITPVIHCETPTFEARQLALLIQ